jgi:regulator of sigma E protease
MITTLIFIAVISVLVFVHELGHFVVAKRSGMKVEEFGFGFPPRLIGITRGETRYSINAIPFGGFVKIYGEDGDDREKARSFGSKSIPIRLAVVLAGVMMNFFFAALILGVGNFIGLRMELPDDGSLNSRAHDVKVQLSSIAPDSPAEKADLQILDEIRGFQTGSESITVHSPDAVKNFVNAHRGQTVTIEVDRAGEILHKSVELRANPPAGQGSMGIAMSLTGKVSYSWYAAIGRGFEDAWYLVVQTVMGFALLFKTLFTEHKLLADVSGPVGIAKMTGQAARFGWDYLLRLVAAISINLAVLNVIPFPALDGGRAFMLIVEAIKGSPVNKRLEMAVNGIGFLFLLGLMLLITIKDIAKFF